MTLLHVSLLVHLIGVGLIFTTLFGGFILEMKFRRAKDPATAQLILKLIRPIGLLSPLSIVVMLLSGTANMHLTGMGLFSASWLTLKLVLFALAAISGVLFGIKGSRRAAIVSRLAGGETPDVSERTLRTLNRQQLIFYVVQTVLILAILTLSIVRPGI
jgi:uncharacterized membrane protein